MKLTQEEKDSRNAKRKATIARKKAVKDAANMEHRRVTALRDARQKVRTIPTRFFVEGETVTYGRTCEVKVFEVLDGGTVYRIGFESGVLMYRPWQDLIKIIPYRDEIFSQEDTMRLDFCQMMLGDVISSFFYNFGTDMEPEYQRGLVWTLDDKTALLDSIFNNRDIGKFVFIHLGYTGDIMHEMLDGKQRLSAIMDFCEDRYEYNGYTYSQLHPRDRLQIDNYRINVAVTRNLLTRKEKLEYFLTLNTRGRDQTTQHLDKVRGMLTEQIEKEKESEQCS